MMPGSEVRAGPEVRRAETASRRILTGYTGYFNARYRPRRHLFQNRYKSVPALDDGYLLVVVRYVHRIPLEAGLVRDGAALRPPGETPFPDSRARR